MAEEKGIWIITAEDVKPQTENKGKKGGMFADEETTIDEEEKGIVSAETLQQNLKAFLAEIDETLGEVKTQDFKSGFKIEEIELSVGVNSKGKIGLWGIGAEVGGNVAIKLKEKNFTEVITIREGLFGLFGEKKEIKLEMIAIPAGEFMMGSNESDNEKPIHPVKLKEFYIGKYPITQAQYQAIMGENPSRFKGENNPVERVSWNNAQEFCQKLSAKTGKQYKLPSEAQWEYACRAGSKTKWCFGDDESQLTNYAWYRDNSQNQTHPVGEKKPNNWGLYDMHGNVWEYCEDDWHKNYQNAPNDGKPWIDNSSKYPVQRGGSWFNLPNNCRSASRNILLARDDFFDDDGFRVVCVSGRTL